MKGIDRSSPQYAIYTNLIKFMDYRNLDFVDAMPLAKKSQRGIAKAPLTKIDMIKSIQTDEYVAIRGADGKNKQRRFRKDVSDFAKTLSVDTYIILFSEYSESISSSAKFVKLIERISDVKPHIDIEVEPEVGADSVGGADDDDESLCVSGGNSKSKPVNVDIICIVKDEISSHVRKKAAAYIFNGNDARGFTHIDFYRYHVFNTVIPAHVSVPHHKIVPAEDEKRLLESLGARKKHLEKIKRKDPPVIWIGGEIGDIIEIETISESTGKALNYRIVI